MVVQKVSDGYVIRLEKGEPVLETLTTFCIDKDVRAGTFSAIGAVSDTEMGYYDLAKKEYFFKHYKEDMEVVSMTGNVALVDASPFLHVHAVLSDTENNTFGGHVKETTVAVTLEVFLHVYPTTLTRVLDEDIGLKLLAL